MHLQEGVSYTSGDSSYICPISELQICKISLTINNLEAANSTIG